MLRRNLWTLALVLLLASGPSSAAILSYSGTLSVELGLGPLPPLVALGSETGVSVSSGGGHFDLGAGVFDTQFCLGTNPTNSAELPTLVSYVEFDLSNTSGTFSGAGSGIAPIGADLLLATAFFGSFTVPLEHVGGGGPVDPVMAVCTELSCSNTVSWTSGGFLSTYRVIVTGGRWTQGRARVTSIVNTTPQGGTTTKTTRTGYDQRTAEHVGRVQYVTPIRVRTIGVTGNFGGFAVLTLDFVPEPGSFVRLGAGAMGLALIGWRRRR